MTDSEEDSTPSDSRPNTHPTKKRKHTYLVRKEEAHGLHETIQALRKELEALQDANGLADFRFHRATMKNRVLKNAVHNQQLAVASAHSMISNHLRVQHETLMYTYVHLPKPRSDRREVLIAMKNAKFRQCYSYLAERSRCLNMQNDHFSEEKFQDVERNYNCHRFDVIQFRGVQSLKQVYDALTFFMFNMEISISETLGDITIREDYDSLNDGAYSSHHRLVSNHDGGVTTEANTVSFAQLFENRNEFSGSPCAVVATDSVDRTIYIPTTSLTVSDVTLPLLLC